MPYSSGVHWIGRKERSVTSNCENCKKRSFIFPGLREKQLVCEETGTVKTASDWNGNCWLFKERTVYYYDFPKKERTKRCLKN